MTVPETAEIPTAETGTGGRFSTVLVANRGEIACRIIATLRRLGVRSVAVYSDADRGARHVALADEAVRLGPAPAAESYLSIERILDAARLSGAEAVHPGYGFLSENVAFARACADAGIVFIGPAPRALEVMGDKIRAKAHVAGSGVPIVPGSSLADASDDDLAVEAERIGYPLLIKPSAGGGGKGMQLVRGPRELAGGLATARRVARSAFGNDTLLIERLIELPRHIEVQVLADAHGAVIHLGERECSLQRRHQKVIEEAPSPLLDPSTRARIGAAACDAARSVDYLGAGTVEFLVSAAAPEEFFFIEMNTRLQVEHPVTELITGLDLVEQQVRIAAGAPLTITQGEVALTGHAIEARLYAESPARGFLPATGRVVGLREARGAGVRVDSSLLAGLDVGADYDPMLAKIIAYGADRREALDRLQRALAETVVLGFDTNVDFLQELLAQPAVQSGDLHTGLIEEMLPVGPSIATDGVLTAVAARAHGMRWPTDDLGPNAVGALWRAGDGWRVGEHRSVRYTLEPEGVDAVEVPVRASDAPASAIGLGEDVMDAADHGVLTVAQSDDGTFWTHRRTPGRGTTVAVRVLDRAERVARSIAERGGPAESGDAELRTPMPGTVVALDVADGAEVEAGDPVVTVEAMKMEYRVLAPHAGTVALHVVIGDRVGRGDPVATVEARASAAESDSPESVAPDPSADTQPEGATS